MAYLRAYLITLLIVLGAAGIVIAAEVWNRHSPRLLSAGIVAIVVGIGGGGLLLGQALRSREPGP